MKRHQGKSKKAADGKGPSSPPALSPRRKWAFRLLALIVLPLFGASLLEGGLRLSGYGYSTSFFKKIQIHGEDCLVENDKFGLRFFPSELSRSPAPIVMRAHKPAGTCRLFVLGESAALGDPRPAFGAARYMEMLLRERFPETKFEIVCVAMTAINSHSILPIARECARNEGDAWILYMGNNEMVGPFGAASVFGSQAPPLGLVRLNLALQKTRVGQLLVALTRKLVKRSSDPANWEGMEMFVNSRVPPSDPRRTAVYHNFASNLADILKAGEQNGVPIVLNTVGVNLRDCAPFASWAVTNLAPPLEAVFDQLMAMGLRAEKQTNFSAAVEAFTRASESQPQRADLHYHLASDLLALTNAAQAKPHLVAACDLDALPFRADSRINSIIDQAGHTQGVRGVSFVDPAHLFATNAADGIPGEEAFYEHVHLNFDGNYRLGSAWAEAVAKAIPDKLHRPPATSWASQDLCERRLGLSDWNRTGVIEDVIRRLGQPPLSSQYNNPQRLAHLRDWLQRLRQNMTTEAAAQAREMYSEALKLRPDDFRLHESFGEFLEATGDLPGAIAQWQQFRDLAPHHHLGYFHSGRLLARLGRLQEAQTELGRALQLQPALGEGWLELGKTHAAQGNNIQALQDYDEARKLLPRDCRVYYFAGRSYSRLNRRVEAATFFQRAERLKPDYWEAIYSLGEELAFAGKDPEARRCFQEVLRQKPNYAMAHLNLGVSLAKSGRWDEAAQQFEEVLRLEPGNKAARQYLDKAAGRKSTGTP